MSRKNFIREKKIYCGDKYLEIDIFPMTTQEKKGRKKKESPSPLKLIIQNEKNSRRHFYQVVHTNFDKDDYHISATYEVIPATPEEAEAIARKFLRRIAYKMEKKGLGKLKYVVVTEYGESKQTGKIVRIHHHIIINKALERDEIEDLWCERKKKGEKQGKSIGWINVDRLKPNERGLEAVCMYITKSKSGKRRWTCSQNLKAPVVKTNDNKYSRRKVEELAKSDDPAHWEKEFSGYILTEIRPEYTDERGWAIYIKMRRLRI